MFAWRSDGGKARRARLCFGLRCALMVYVLSLSAAQAMAQTACVEEQELTAPNAAGNDSFGHSISVSGDTAVVGAHGEGCTAGVRCGSAYVLKHNGTSWVEVQKLTASDAAVDAAFGISVSVSGNIAVVGALGRSCASGIRCGAAYVFRFNGTSWTQEQRLIASDAWSGDDFGYSVSVSADTILVGARLEGFDNGSAYIYRFNGTSWAQEQKLTASDAAEDDLFGVSVSVNGDTAFVGALLGDCAAGPDCGVAYVYRFDGTNWVEVQKLIEAIPKPQSVSICWSDQ